MINQLLYKITLFFVRHPKVLKQFFMLFFIGIIISLLITKTYQHWDDDPDRGAIAIENGGFGESFSTPVYLDQNWSAADSLWFYNTTQGSNLLPYDFFLSLEQQDSTTLLRADHNMDMYRYLVQKPTFFNPDGLPVGMVKDSYQGKDYMGFTCAACHTGQVNYQGKAIRIDGAPAMADMTSFLKALEQAMIAAQSGEKNQRFVTAVLALNNDYSSAQQVNDSLKQWTDVITTYNTVNHSHIKYGYARLDAFGRIYNRVLQYIINKDQMADLLAQARSATGQPLLTNTQIANVLEGISATIIGEQQLAVILKRLQSPAPKYPALSYKHLLTVRNLVFNEPDAPVSYPFLWDTPRSTYVQWNGLADNAALGPIGRNAGEVIGVFATLDWQAKPPGWSISSLLSGQSNKNNHVNFKSSVNLTNLQRLEDHLHGLSSPQWPQDILGNLNKTQVTEGKEIFDRYCQSCHANIDRSANDRIVVSNMSSLDVIGTDIAMAHNSVHYNGKSGNFKNTYQKLGVGSVVITETAPVVQILTSATTGTVATPDADKWFLRRWIDWTYLLVSSYFKNTIKPSIKNGDYQPDTTANPYNSLLAYKARSLNGIWATAPYLHNGSVPTLYDLLLPAQRPTDPADGKYRPTEFTVGSREFDPQKVGFRTDGYDGFKYTTRRVGDMNDGHDFGTRDVELANGQMLHALTEAQRWALVEYLKSL